MIAIFSSFSPVYSTSPEFCKREKGYGAKTLCCQEKGSKTFSLSLSLSDTHTIVSVHKDTIHASKGRYICVSVIRMCHMMTP